MWLGLQTVDSSHVLSMVSMHLVILLCVLLVSAINNSIAEEQFGPKPEIAPESIQSASNKEQSNNDIQSQSHTEIGEDRCWLKEDYESQGPCQPCNDFMKLSQPCCGETGFKQKIMCTKSGKITYKSCPRTKWSIEKSFWTFEGVMLGLGMCSGIVALVRRRKLDWKALERVRKQIANSV